MGIITMGPQYLIVSGNPHYVGRYYKTGGERATQWVHRQGMFFSCDGRMWRIMAPGGWIQLRRNHELTGFWEPDLIVTGPHGDLESGITTSDPELVWLCLCFLMAIVVGVVSYGWPMW